MLNKVNDIAVRGYTNSGRPWEELNMLEWKCVYEPERSERLCDIVVLVSSRVAFKLGKDIHGFHEVGSDLVDLHRA